MGINFSLDSDGGVVVQQNAGGGFSNTTFNGGVSGGSQSSGPMAQGGTDINAFANAERRQGVLGSGIDIDSFNKLTQGMIQPYIDRAKKEQYAEGMAQAAQGKSLIDIENDQPWYTKIYGPDATVQGAQMFNINAAMNDAQTQFMQAMPQLRERSPDQVRQYLVDKMGQAPTTGDQFTDAMVQQKLAEQLPKMLDQHMQQYVQYTQEQNYNGFANMGTSAAKAMQSTLAASPNATDDDINAAHADYRAQLAKPDNMTTNAYQRALRDITISNATNGNWQGVRAIQEMPEYQQMDPQMQAELTDKIPLLEAQAAQKNPANMSLQDSRDGLVFHLTKGISPYGSTPADHAAAIQAMQSMNDQWKLKNGDATPLFTQTQMRQTLLQMDENNQRRALGAQKALLGQQNISQAQAAWTNSFTSGDGGASMKAYEGTYPSWVKDQQLDSIYNNAVQQPTDSPAQQAFWPQASQNAKSGLLVPALQKTIQRQTAGLLDGDGPATNSQVSALTIAQNLRNGPGGVQAVKAYFGDQAEGALAILDTVQDFRDPEQMATARQQIALGKNAQPSDLEKKAAIAYVKGQDPSAWQFWKSGQLDGYHLNDAAIGNLSNEIGPIMAQKMKAFPSMSQDDAAQSAMRQYLGNADLMPGTYVPEDRAKWGPGNGFQDFVAKNGGAANGQTSTLYQHALNDIVKQQLTAQIAKNGGDMSNFDADKWSGQYGMYMGNGRMMLMMTKGDGSNAKIYVDARDVGAQMDKHRLDAAYQQRKVGDLGSYQSGTGAMDFTP
ncbi:hypothetical protein CI15_19005 [Paraburkholderia monticola]|uniref:Uncharacterized protein n=1 Tax=Paraburkholderia monticola TaxID=1399968 RepID=A0A149PN75_9BURK|nr:hypothetical protein [Paraburkholderia monticola]KXU86527.1 hypothetical protein CI15_19005 [Paraburkholderia monticola]